MDKVTQEIDKMAEKVEKATQDPKEKLFSIIKSLGPDGIKAKLLTLSEEDKVVLKAVMEEMKFQKDKAFENFQKTLDSLKPEDDATETLSKSFSKSLFPEFKEMKVEDTKDSVFHQICYRIQDLNRLREKSYSVPTEEVPEAKKVFETQYSKVKADIAKLVDKYQSLKKAVTFDKEAQSAKHIQGKVTDTIIQEEIASDDADEKLMKPAAANFDHQGTPTDGWQGQVIKAFDELSDEDVEKYSSPFKHLITELPDEFEKAYVGFEKLKGKLSQEKGVDNPAAVAASIGRKKYGNKKFQAAAAEGKKMKKSEFIEEMKKSDKLLTDFVFKALKITSDPQLVLSKCQEMGLEKAKVMGAMKEYAKDQKVFNKVKKANKDMKKSGSSALPEQENPEAKKQDGDAPNLQVGGQNRSGVKKEEVKDLNVAAASKNAQAQVNNLNPETMAKGQSPEEKEAEAKAARDRKEEADKQNRAAAKEEKKAMKKCSWDDEQRLLKARTQGRNFSFNVEHFVNETIKKTDGTKTDIKKSEKVDLNDLIEKAQDRNWDELDHTRRMEENKKAQNGRIVKSFEDKDVAACFGMTEEEAKKITG